MKFNDFESATLRMVSYKRMSNIPTLQFNNFNEALEHLIIGDSVLVFVNGGRYVMKVFSVDKDCITCADDVGIVQFRRNREWIINGLERIQYD